MFAKVVGSGWLFSLLPVVPFRSSFSNERKGMNFSLLSGLLFDEFDRTRANEIPRVCPQSSMSLVMIGIRKVMLRAAVAEDGRVEPYSRRTGLHWDLPSRVHSFLLHILLFRLCCLQGEKSRVNRRTV